MMRRASNRWGNLWRKGDYVVVNLPRGGQETGYIDKVRVENGAKRITLDSGISASPDDIVHNHTLLNPRAGERFMNPKTRKSARKRPARTSKAYVRRPSQITKKAPSKRLVRRRTKVVKHPVKGYFPNPTVSTAKYEALLQSAMDAIYRRTGQKISDSLRQAYLSYYQGLADGAGALGLWTAAERARHLDQANAWLNRGT